jgi:hypothetical protein
LPEEDIGYFGSFHDETFKPKGKVILFVCETRQEVAEIEIELHDFFDVAVNPQFANRAKAKSTGFDRTGVIAGSRTKEWKKAHSERVSGENNPCYGRTGEKHPNYGRTGALSPISKPVTAIQPDGTELHFGSGHEAARELGINPGHLCGRYLKTGKSPTRGKFKDWQFVYENSENF